MRNALGTKTVAALIGAGALTASSLGLASTASASTSSTTSTGTAVTTAAAGDTACAPNGKRVPRGAARVDAGDVDGDGENDQVWVSGTRKGIRTASGAVFSQKIENAGGPEVGVRVLHLDKDVVAVIEEGRTTYVSAFANCRLKKTVNKNGDRISFNRGLSSPYRDLGCIGDDDYSELNALTLKRNTAYKKPWSVKQTVLNISASGAKATNGDSTTKRYATKAKALKALKSVSSAETCSTELATKA